MKIVIYWDKKDLRELIYNILLLKNLKKDIYVFLNNYSDVDKLKKIKERYNITFLVSKTKISKLKAIKIIKERINDDLLFIDGRINFNIRELKRREFDKDFITFGYKSRVLRKFRLNLIDRVFFFKRGINNRELIIKYLNITRPDIELDFLFDKAFLKDLINNVKRILRKIIYFLDKILKRKIIRDLINHKIGTTSLRLFTFFLAVFLSRYFLPDTYGEYVNFASLSLGISYLISLGIPNIAFKFFSKNPERGSEYITSFLIIYLFLSFLILLSLFFLKNIVEELFTTQDMLIIFLIILTSFFIAVRSTLPSIFISDLDFNTPRNFDILEGLFKLLFVSILSIFLYLKGSLIGLFLSFFILSIIEALTLLKKYPSYLNLKFSTNRIKEVLKETLSINYTNILYNFYSQIRLNIISITLSASMLAFYYNSYNLSVVLMSFVSIYSVILPRIVRWDIEKIRENSSVVLTLQLLINLPIALILWIFSKDILTLVYGENYSNATFVFRLSLLLYIISPLSIYYNILWIKSKLKEVSIINLISLLSLILSDILLIKRFSIIGAMISMIVFEFVRDISSYIYFRSIYNYDNKLARPVY